MTDQLIRFRFQDTPVRGAWVRINQTWHDACARQAYPYAIKLLLGEMLASSALLADSVKFDGAVTIQCQSQGWLRTALAECNHKTSLRGIARWSEEQAPHIQATAASTKWRGENQLSHAETLDLNQAQPMRDLLNQDAQMAISLIPDQGEFYQGRVELVADTLAANLEHYFNTSEQLDTKVHLHASATQVTAILLQRLPEDRGDLFNHGTDVWQELCVLLSTLGSAELDKLTLEPLLRRLFATHNILVSPAKSLAFSCTCSETRMRNALRSMTKVELLELIEEEGKVEVTCEFCGSAYVFDAIDVHLIFDQNESQPLH